MGKFLLELALFAIILYQISMLTSKNRHADNLPQRSVGSLGALYQDAAATTNLVLTSANPHTEALKDMARKEADRIVATGDYGSFIEEAEQHGLLQNAPYYLQ